jgi:hypothetical protein
MISSGPGSRRKLKDCTPIRTPSIVESRRLRGLWRAASTNGSPASVNRPNCRRE